MYRTDKQFMKNPATASQRIYIGGLPLTVVADDLDLKFRQHGKILGIVQNRGFAFIQFETDEEAQKAIRFEAGAIIHGKRISVKPALQDRKAMNTPNPKPQESNNQQKPTINQTENTNIVKKTEPEEPPKPNHPPEEDASKTQGYEEQELEMIAEKFQEEDKHQDFPPKPQSIISSENFDDEDSRGQMRKRGMRGGRRGGKPWHNDRFIPHPPPLDRDRFRGAPPFIPQERYPEFEPPMPMMDRPEKYDCEIIVVSKMLTEYAEYIESRLKALGLIVDLLFPNADVPIGRVIANISSRGCLYAILVTPQNKENQSLTLNVLHGIPQEHRNMPVEDSLLFITRNFDAYMRGEKISTADNEGKMTIYDKHPNGIQLLLNILAENRVLTSVQYDKILRYLEERRELQVQFELSEGIDVGTENQASKQTELQNRIMNILNKSSDNSRMESEPGNAPPPPSTSTPLLKDPTVQKALDSLLTGDMFKNIAG